jgi:dihydroorotate dehydrogenase (fumarate)/dihydroorotate dehydrogenase
LAAGFDKDGDVIDALQCLGFGYVVVGSVMPEPRRGHPRPRIIRYPEEESLVNCLGLPSKGLAHARSRLQRRRVHRMPVIANIHGSTVEEFAGCVGALEPHVSAIEVSLICPNVDDPALEFLEPAGFQRLWRVLGRFGRRPLLLKLPSYETPAERSARLDLVDLALELGVAGFTISGTFMRPEPRLSLGRGNVSGTPARERALGFVRDMYSVVGRKADIKALGGLSSGLDAFNAIAAGATSVELLTGLIYQGPSVARDVNRALTRLMAHHGISSVDELRGSGVSVPRPQATGYDI